LRETGKDDMAQLGDALEPGALPAPRAGLLVGVGGLVANLAAFIAFYLARNGRRRAIQICRDFADRAAFGVKAGNLAPLLE
jgi:hypothetical protein